MTTTMIYVLGIFLFANKEKRDIQDHMKTAKHKSAINATEYTKFNVSTNC